MTSRTSARARSGSSQSNCSTDPAPPAGVAPAASFLCTGGAGSGIRQSTAGLSGCFSCGKGPPGPRGRSLRDGAAPVGLAVDQLGGADGGGEGVGVASARVYVGRGVGEFDHVLVAVLDGPGEGLLGR